MVWTLQMQEGTTSTLDLNDRVTYFLNRNGFIAPPPPERSVYGGANLFRHGADLMQRKFDNRSILLDCMIKGTNATALGTAVSDIWTILRKAEEYARDGIGTQVQLKYQWEGAPNPVYFNVITGIVDLGPELHSPYLSQGTRIPHANISLICEPFAVGTAETIENFVKDPSFEIAGSAFADWIISTSTGTISRSTAYSKFGTASVLMVRTAGTGTQDLQQKTTAIGTGTTVSALIWVRPINLGTSGDPAGTTHVQLLMSYNNTAGTYVGLKGGTLIATGTAFVKLEVLDLIPAAHQSTVGTVIMQIQLLGGTGSGTIAVDGCLLVKGSTIPVAWVSGRDVSNHFDDNGQAHINYLDSYDVPGDVTALVQIKALENESHTDFWIGARHAGRQQNANIFIEAEAFTSTGTAIVASDASKGTFQRQPNIGSVGSAAASPVVWTYPIATPPQGIFRVLARAATPAGTGTRYLGAGYSYGGFTKDPSGTTDYVGMTHTDFRIKDLGVLSIPPTIVPAASTIGTFTLRIAMFESTGTAGTIDIDWVMLLPVDQGMAYCNKTSGADVVMADSRTIPRAIYLLNSTDVLQSAPANQQGEPPEAHPKGSRYYFVSDDGTADIDDGWSVSFTYLPRWLQVR